jgi:hypothetical protein
MNAVGKQRFRQRDAVMLAELERSAIVRIVGKVPTLGGRVRVVSAHTAMDTPATVVVSELRALADAIEASKPALVDELLR